MELIDYKLKDMENITTHYNSLHERSEYITIPPGAGQVVTYSNVFRLAGT
jgi:hypothetical protein